MIYVGGGYPPPHLGITMIYKALLNFGVYTDDGAFQLHYKDTLLDVSPLIASEWLQNGYIEPYKDAYLNETVKLNSLYIVGGYVTTNATQIAFTLNFSKTFNANTVGEINGNIAVRGINGAYLLNTTFDAFRQSGGVINVYRSGLNDTSLTIILTKSGGYGVTNNTPVGVQLNNFTVIVA